MNKEEIVNAVCMYLDGKGYKYERLEDGNLLRLGVSIRGRLRGVKIYWQFTENSFLIYTYSPLSAGMECLGEMLKYIAMANQNIISGNFEIDVHNGEIRYKAYQNLDGFESVAERVLDHNLVVGIWAFERYGDGLAAISFGFSDAETEIQKIEGGR